MIRSVLGIESFGINAWRATEAGQEIIGEHDELGSGAGGHEELYFVLSGRATFTVDGEPRRCAGRLARLRQGSGNAAWRGRRRGGHRDPRHRRTAGSRVLGLAVGAVCRGAALLDDRRLGRARSRSSTAQLAEDPANANVLYNLACAESRSGQAGAAIDHLTRAVELVPRFAELAQTDGDLDAIRGDDRFPAAPARG